MTERALVLGGGGASGNAWTIGVIAGLFEAGLDVTQADLIIGTSAGSTAAVQISGTTRPPELLADIMAEVPPPPRGSSGSDHMERTSAIINAAKDATDMRRKMGAAFLEIHDASAGWRGIVGSRLRTQNWPQRT